MTEEQERKFDALIARGFVRVDVADALRELIEEVAGDAWDRGTVAGASPFDGSWPVSR